MMRNIILGFLLFIGTSALFAQDIKVFADLESDEVFKGESFILQIRIEGSNSPEQPDLSGFSDFDVEFAGQRDQSQQSITIVNGDMRQVVSQAYIFQYRLTPRKAGTLRLPPVMITVDGKSFMTNAKAVRVIEPSEVDDFKLRVSLSKRNCYLGEPVEVVFTFYYADNPKDLLFNFPLFKNKDFFILDAPDEDSRKTRYAYLNVNDQKTGFEYSNEPATIGGRQYNYISFKRKIIPRKSGTLSLEEATASFSTLSGYKQVRDSFFGNRREAVYRKSVIPSNNLFLTVKGLPKEGAPTNYSFLVGTTTIRVTAAPREIRVGDPITLRIELSGPVNLKNARIPDLNSIEPLAKDFKIPADMAPGVIEGNKKIFTQTIRARREDVTAVPPLRIGYFDTVIGKYRDAVSEAIPLKVSAGDIKTFKDLEGLQDVEIKSELEEWNEGIAHNYEGKDVLVNQAAGAGNVFANPLFVVLLIFPVILYGVLFYFIRFSHLHRGTDADKKARKAAAHLRRTLKEIKEGTIQAKNIFGLLAGEVNKYVGAKLKIENTGALTFKDVEGRLKEHKIKEEILSRLQEIYKTCEAGYYAGTVTEDKMHRLCDLTVEVTDELERSFK